MFEPHFQRTQRDRIDQAGMNIHNESSKLPGHEERMKAHCKRVQQEYLDFRGKDGRYTKLYRDKRSKD